MYTLSMLGTVAVSRVDSGGGGVRGNVVSVVVSNTRPNVVVQGVSAVAVVTDGSCHAYSRSFFFQRGLRGESC